MSSRIPCCVSVEKALNIRDQQKFGKKKELRISSHLQNIVKWTTSTVTRSRLSRRFSHITTTQLLRKVQNLMEDELKM